MNCPKMAPYQRHLLVCTGRYCAPQAESRALYALLPALLTRYELLFGADRVKRGETACLGVCEGGPIVVSYPDGRWYHHVTPALLERIVRDGVLGGAAVEENCFHALPHPSPSVEP